MMLTTASLLFGSLVLAAPPADAGDVRSRLDAAVEVKWKTLGIVPEGAADDATFLRRIYLDLAGRVPPPLVAREFLDDKDPGKRAKLVERLLASEDFTDYWGRLWAQALTGKRAIKQEKYDGRVLHEYLKASLAANKSYRQIVTELICAEGSSDGSGPANFLIRYDAKPTDLAGAVGKQFLGVSLQCAQCHDHPFAKWKKDDFWGVAAFFGRTRLFESSNEGEEQYFAVLDTRRGELLVPDPAGKPGEDGKLPMKKVLPRLPVADGPAIQGPRRQALAAWITASDNPFFARQAVNRVWGQLFGTPLTGALDRPIAEADGSHPAILNLLADDFNASGGDIKRLVRTIVLSRAYDRKAGSGDPKEAESRYLKTRNLARFPVRPLNVDQLYQSIVQATGHRAAEAMEAGKETDDEEEADPPLQLLGERAQTVQRSLALLNSDYVQKATEAGAKAAVAVNGRKIAAGHVDWLFLATLSRRPTADEATQMQDLLKNGKATRGLEDILWVIVNSVEFSTNH
jgi:hypothetical protein